MEMGYAVIVGAGAPDLRGSRMIQSVSAQRVTSSLAEIPAALAAARIFAIADTGSENPVA